MSRAKIFDFHRLRPAEAQIRLQAGEAVGREARALLEEDADLVLPVDVVEREGDETELFRRLGVERLADLRARGLSSESGSPRKRLASRDRPLVIG